MPLIVVAFGLGRMLCGRSLNFLLDISTRMSESEHSSQEEENTFHEGGSTTITEPPRDEDMAALPQAITNWRKIIDDISPHIRGFITDPIYIAQEICIRYIKSQRDSKRKKS